MLAAVHSPAAVTRERIAAMFWGDLAEERARHSLRQIYGPAADAAIVEVSGETLRRCQLARPMRPESAALAASTDRGELERALALHAGAFLEGLTAKEERLRSGWAPSARLSKRRWKQ